MPRLTPLVALTLLLASGCNTFESVDDHPFRPDTAEPADTHGADADLGDAGPDVDAPDTNDLEDVDLDVTDDDALDADATDSTDTNTDTDTDDTDVVPTDPVVVAVAPAAGSAVGGESVVLTGAALDGLDGEVIDVYFGSIVVTATLDGDRLLATSPPHVAGTVPVEVRVRSADDRVIGRLDPGFTFVPEIVSIGGTSSGAVDLGTIITVVAAGLDSTAPHANLLYLDGVRGTERAIAPNSVQIVAGQTEARYTIDSAWDDDPAIGSGGLALEVHGVRSFTSPVSALHVVDGDAPPVPTVTRIDVDTGANTITLLGAGFENLQASTTTVRLPNVSGTVPLTSATPTQLELTLPTDAHSGFPVIVTSAGDEFRADVPLVVPGAPVQAAVGLVTPAAGPPGAVVVLEGIGLPVTNTTVRLAGIDAVVLSARDTRIVFAVPDTAVSGPAEIELDGDGSNGLLAGHFAVTGAAEVMAGDAMPTCPDGPLATTEIDPDLLAARSSDVLFMSQGPCIVAVNLGSAPIAAAGVDVPGGTFRTVHRASDDVTALAVEPASANNPRLFFSTGPTIERILLDSTGGATRIAGAGPPGHGGDHGPALDARFSGIRDLLVYDAQGTAQRLLLVADDDNGAVRLVNIGTANEDVLGVALAPNHVGVVLDGLSPGVGDNPTGVAFDDQGNVYVTTDDQLLRVSAARCTRTPGTDDAAVGSGCNAAASDALNLCGSPTSTRVSDASIQVALGQVDYDMAQLSTSPDLGRFGNGVAINERNDLLLGGQLGLLRGIAGTSGSCISPQSTATLVAGDDPSDGIDGGAGASGLLEFGVRPFRIPNSSNFFFIDHGRIRELVRGSTSLSASTVIDRAGAGLPDLAATPDASQLPPLDLSGGLVYDPTRNQLIFEHRAVIYGLDLDTETITRLAGNGAYGNHAGTSALDSSLGPVLGMHLDGDSLYLVQGLAPRLTRLDLSSTVANNALTELVGDCAPDDGVLASSATIPAADACLRFPDAPLGITRTTGGLVLFSDGGRMLAYNPTSSPISNGFVSGLGALQITVVDAGHGAHALDVATEDGVATLFMASGSQVKVRTTVASTTTVVSPNTPLSLRPGRSRSTPLEDLLARNLVDIQRSSRSLLVAERTLGLVYAFGAVDSAVTRASRGVVLFGTGARPFAVDDHSASTSARDLTGLTVGDDGRLFVAAAHRILAISLP